MNKRDFYNCTTIYMGKYVEGSNKGFDCQYEVALAKHRAEAFALWSEVEFFDEKNGYLILKISYVNDNFFKEESLATIKFFMQMYDFSYCKSVEERKPIDDDSK